MSGIELRRYEDKFKVLHSDDRVEEILDVFIILNSDLIYKQM